MQGMTPASAALLVPGLLSPDNGLVLFCVTWLFSILVNLCAILQSAYLNPVHTVYTRSIFSEMFAT